MSDPPGMAASDLRGSVLFRESETVQIVKVFERSYSRIQDHFAYSMGRAVQAESSNFTKSVQLRD
ncbi:hypothetical protein [Phormidesmis sp. 146-33]